jgi:hypothetical protein
MLMSLFTMGPAADKAEKLKVDNQGWDREGEQFVIGLSCQFGIATAGEHADFMVRTELAIKKDDGNTYDLAGERDIKKVEGAEKDADNFIATEPIRIEWDRDGGNFTGEATVTVTTSLIGPSGKQVGDSITKVFEGIDIQPPSGEFPGNPGTTEITSVCRQELCELILPEQEQAKIHLMGQSVIHLESDFFSAFVPTVTLQYSEGNFDITYLCSVVQYQSGSQNHIEVYFDTTELPLPIPIGTNILAYYTITLHPTPTVPAGSKLEDSLWIFTDDNGLTD